MRRLALDVFLLGMVSGVVCGLGVTGWEIVQNHWYLGFSLNLFGYRIQGEEGGITYPVGRNGLFNLALTCLGGWLAWGIAALNREDPQTPTNSTGSERPCWRLERRAWILAIFCGCMIALLWAALYFALHFDVIARFRSHIRLIVISVAVVLCIDRFRFCWRNP